jgi:hypothetical protein
MYHGGRKIEKNREEKEEEEGRGERQRVTKVRM